MYFDYPRDLCNYITRNGGIGTAKINGSSHIRAVRISGQFAYNLQRLLVGYVHHQKDNYRNLRACQYPTVFGIIMPLHFTMNKLCFQ